MDEPFSPPERIPSLPGLRAPVDPSGFLPYLYRAEGGSFVPLIGAIVDVLERVRDGVRALGASPAGTASPSLEPASKGFEGTARGLLMDSAGSRGPQPEVWHGVTVRPTGEPGELEVVPSAGPSAVIAWPEDSDPARPSRDRLPDIGLLPAGARLSFVMLRGAAPVPAIAGDRFLGEVLA
jgi:hypothetical protein